jgi:hypothetical protein
MNEKSKNTNAALSEAETIRRRDDAVRRALSTPPKPLKEMKKGKAKQQGEPPTASEKRT